MRWLYFCLYFWTQCLCTNFLLTKSVVIIGKISERGLDSWKTYVWYFPVMTKRMRFINISNKWFEKLKCRGGLKGVGGGGGWLGWGQGLPIFGGAPKKIVYKTFLEQKKISYTLDRILCGYVSRSSLWRATTYTYYIATCFHSLTLPNALGECRMNRLTIAFMAYNFALLHVGMSSIKFTTSQGTNVGLIHPCWNGTMSGFLSSRSA